MSPLSTERLSVGICPTQVGIIHIPSHWRRKDIAKEIIDVVPQADGKTTWQNILDSFSNWLGKKQPHRPKTTLVLSNHFVRFALVPWSTAASKPDEEAELARACFESRYGDMKDWTIRFDASDYGTARIACAVETAFIDASRHLFERHNLLGGGVRPAFVTAWNRSRCILDRAMGKTDAMFAVAESDSLVIASRRANAWHSLRSIATRASVNELPTLIEREAVLQGFSELPPAWILRPSHENPSFTSTWKGHQQLHIIENANLTSTAAALVLAELATK